MANADWLTGMGGGTQSFVGFGLVCFGFFFFFISGLKSYFFLLSAHASSVGLSVSHFLLLLVSSGWALCVSTLH